MFALFERGPTDATQGPGQDHSATGDENDRTTGRRCPAGNVHSETLVKRGAKKRVATPLEAPEAFRVEAVDGAQDAEMEAPALRAPGLAHYWQRLLDTGRFGSLTEIAAAEGMDLGQVSRIARLAWLQPKLVDAVLANGNNSMAEPE